MSAVPPAAPGRTPGASFAAPEKPELALGFVALTDCASVVMAEKLGLYRKYGLSVTLERQPSWAALRDRLLVGQLDAAHVLYGLVYGLHLGIGGLQENMAVLMGLNRNGQGIVLSRRLRDAGAVDGPSLKALVERGARRYTFAQTFPTGTHAMWLNYWLAAAGIDPRADVDVITIPPARMQETLRAGTIDGFCVGEPWSGLYVNDENDGFRVLGTGQIWPDHPEKVLGTTRRFVERYPNTARALVAAVLEAARYVDEPGHRAEVAAAIAAEDYVDAPIEAVLQSLAFDATPAPVPAHPSAAPADRPLRFFDGGKVNFPHPSDGMWFMSQLRRWQLLDRDVDYRAVAAEVNRVTLYEEVANALGIPLPAAPAQPARLFDGVPWDGDDVRAYLAQFPIAAAGA